MAGTRVPLTPPDTAALPETATLDTEEVTPDLTLAPARPGETRHALAARTLREAVLDGRLPEGTRLPGHRR
ncbi:hypothetical protein IHN59_05190, partial [Deinococcus sp. 23YEL01]|nr:hypothetical protein [Deinococcus sp. 23YEL01]